MVPASHYSRLSPYLARVIGGDSAQKAMIPASYCMIDGMSVTAGDQFISSGSAGDPVMLAYWGIAAARNDADARFDQLFTLEFWTSDWHVQKPTRAAFIEISTLKRSLTRLPETGERPLRGEDGEDHPHLGRPAEAGLDRRDRPAGGLAPVRRAARDPLHARRCPDSRPGPGAPRASSGSPARTTSPRRSRPRPSGSSGRSTGVGTPGWTSPARASGAPAARG